MKKTKNKKMNRAWFPALLIMLTALALAVSTHAAPTVLSAANSTGISGQLEFDASPLKTMQPTTFTLRMQDADGRPVETRMISCELTMPAMPMPDNNPDVLCQRDICRGEAIFTMAGAWRATFRSVLKNGEMSELVFDIDMVQMQ